MSNVMGGGVCLCLWTPSTNAWSRILIEELERLNLILNVFNSNSSHFTWYWQWRSFDRNEWHACEARPTHACNRKRLINKYVFFSLKRLRESADATLTQFSDQFDRRFQVTLRRIAENKSCSAIEARDVSTVPALTHVNQCGESRQNTVSIERIKENNSHALSKQCALCQCPSSFVFSSTREKSFALDKVNAYHFFFFHKHHEKVHAL